MSVPNRSRLPDYEHCTQLPEHCRLELNTKIDVQLFRDPISRNPLGRDSVSDCGG